MPLKKKELKVSLKVPYVGGIEGIWEVDDSQRKAAWEMYVELITRVSLAREDPTEGSLRSALSSLHELFDITRGILRAYGPDIAQSKEEGNLSFGYLSVAILNLVIRPVLSTWHPLLSDYESKKPEHISSVEHEQNWEHNDALRGEMFEMRQMLIEGVQDIV